MPKRKRKPPQSGYFGVRQVPSGRYDARISIESKRTNLGFYDTSIEAARAYDKEAIKLRRKLNLPNEAPEGYSPIHHSKDGRWGVVFAKKKPKKSHQHLLTKRIATGDTPISSGYYGVTQIRGKYRAQLWIKRPVPIKRITGTTSKSYTSYGQMKYIGLYQTALEAAQAHDKEAIRLRRPFSTLNYPKKAPVGYTPKQQTFLCINNATGYRGVTARAGNFAAQGRYNGKAIQIGTFGTALEAAVAYDRHALKNNKSSTYLNFPDMVHNLNIEPKRSKSKLPSDNTTGYRGITRVKNKYQAQHKINGKTKHLGTFDTAKEAAIAFDQASIQKGKLPTHKLNFPEGVPINAMKAFNEASIRQKRLPRLRHPEYVGVTNASSGRFTARIRIAGTRKQGNRKTKWIGTFDTAKEAAFAFDQAAIETGMPHTLNFPNGGGSTATSSSSSSSSSSYTKKKQKKKTIRVTKETSILTFEEYTILLNKVAATDNGRIVEL